MLDKVKNVKSEEHVLGQYPVCIYTAAESRSAGRTESLSILVLLPTMEAGSSLYVLLLHVCKYLLLCVRCL